MLTILLACRLPCPSSFVQLLAIHDECFPVKYENSFYDRFLTPEIVWLNVRT